MSHFNTPSSPSAYYVQQWQTMPLREEKRVIPVYAWTRSRGNRHRQAHCLKFDKIYANSSYGPKSQVGLLRTACGVFIPIEELMQYKQYDDTPARSCRSCVYWLNHEHLRALAE